MSDRDTGSRRGFMLASLGLLIAGCGKATKATSMLPGPAWDVRPDPVEPMFSPMVSSTPSVGRPPLARTFARSEWASGNPVPSLMNRMLPIRYITIHHDGMTPFYGNTSRDAAARLDSIRRGHRGSQWGDIGYHFAVDRVGNVFDARPLQYQGAHVKNHNEGNIGIVVLGNFELQRPTKAQLTALNRHVTSLMRRYRVPVSRVRTHQEWASTACPGRNLQRFMVDARRDGMFG